MTVMAAERTYQARRIDTGVYVQPSNDGKRMYVIASYFDGRDHGLESGPRSATYWAWGELTDAKAREVERTATYDADEALSLILRVAYEGDTGYASKREATADALSHGERA